MPALVNSGGNCGIRPRGMLYSEISNVDAYCHSRKRSRLAAPFSFRGGDKKQQSVSMDSLPDECLFEILRRLPGNRERTNSACVSKRWLMLLSSMRPSEIAVPNNKCNHDSSKPSKKPLPDLNSVDLGEEDEEVGIEGCLTRCLEGRKATDVSLAAMAVGTAGRGGLGKLMIRGSHPARGVTDLGLSTVARGCPSLRVLSMWEVPLVTDEGLSEFASGCSMLEKLDLFRCPLISDKGLMAVAHKCPNLKSLTIDSCLRIGNEGLQAIGRFCPKLECVSIKDCPLVGDQGITSLMCSASSSLTNIKLQNLSIGDMSLACIGYYGKSVTQLVLAGLQNVAERGFWVMGNTLGLQKLRSLVITSCCGVTDTGLEAVAKGCPNLKQLCLRRSCFVSDVGLKAFVEATRALEHLQLEECNRISLVGVLNGLLNCSSKFKTLALARCIGIRDIESYPAALPQCASLRSLTIRDCPGFTSSSLVVVGKICPNLTHVDLSGLVGITDAGLLPLIESSEMGFVKVSLKGCANLTDAAISTLVRVHGDTLQVLNLDGCNRLTDAIPLAITERCSVLEELDMSRANITDYGVAFLASARHLQLHILSLSGCSKVTQKSLPLLGNMGSSLVGLNLQHCNLIGSYGIGSLEEKMWWCDILS